MSASTLDLRRVATFVGFPAVSALATLVATARYGIGLSSDSASYLRLARDIGARGFLFLSEPTAISRPPGYPLVLAAMVWVSGEDADVVARVLGILASATITVGTLFVAERLALPGWAVCLVGAAMCLASPMLEITSMAWSEPLYVALVVSLLAWFARPVRSPWLAAAGGVAAVAVGVRYVGIVGLLAGAVWLLWERGGSVRRRVVRASIFAVPSVGVGAALALRNLALSATLSGAREVSTTSLWENLRRVLAVVVGWVTPAPGPGVIVLLAVVVLAAGGALGLGARRRERPVWRDVAAFLSSPWSLLAAFVVLHVGVLALSATWVAYDAIDTRLVSPIVPPLILLAVKGLASLVAAAQSTADAAHRWAARGAALAVVLVAVSAASTTATALAEKWGEGAGGFATRAWHESPLIRGVAALEIPAGQVVFSNASDALYLLTGIPARRSPARSRAGSPSGSDDADADPFASHPGLDGSLLVWSNVIDRNFLLTPAELARVAELTVVRRYPDGVVYALRARR